ncbi:MAG: LysR family transcriptional regulator [Clostridiales bacterium]|nr:LysR family transcriptional regulator [Clostridiales bacterium]
MELRILRYLLVVAREENITRAADILHISQPTLSRQIMQLEEELGVKLFTRGKQNVCLTSEGILFRRRAQEIVNLADKAKDEMQQENETLVGTISIGCGELRSMEELSEIIAAFQIQYPLVKFEIHSAYNMDVKERIEQGLLDMGLMVEPIEISKYGFVRMETKERWGALVHKDSFLADKTEICPRDLVNIPVISCRNEATQNELLSWFGKYAKNVNIQATYNLLYNAVILLKKKGGVLLGLDLEADYEWLKFIPFSPKIEFSSVLAWKDRQAYSKTAEVFIRFVREYKSHIPD